jgi:hypothetical protein
MLWRLDQISRPKISSNLLSEPAHYTDQDVGDWYLIGLSLGLGAGAGVALAGALATSRLGIAVATIGGAGAGVAIGLAVDDWNDMVAGAAGAAVAALSAAQILRGALRRGGTRGGTAALFVLAAVGVAALAFVPALGYLEGVALPALAARLRRRAPERYAGLRTLARD